MFVHYLTQSVPGRFGRFARTAVASFCLVAATSVCAEGTPEVNAQQLQRERYVRDLVSNIQAEAAAKRTIAMPQSQEGALDVQEEQNSATPKYQMGFFGVFVIAVIVFRRRLLSPWTREPAWVDVPRAVSSPKTRVIQREANEAAAPKPAPVHRAPRSRKPKASRVQPILKDSDGTNLFIISDDDAAGLMDTSNSLR